MGTDRDRIEQSLPLRPVEFHILLSLASGERHGYESFRTLKPAANRRCPMSVLYRALARMADGGLIAAALAQAKDSSDERRNYYRITEKGLRREGGSAPASGADARRKVGWPAGEGHVMTGDARSTWSDRWFRPCAGLTDFREEMGDALVDTYRRRTTRR